MRARGALRAAALLAAALWASPLWAKKDNPEFNISPFKYLPQNLNYFEDSDIILFQDAAEGVIYRSSDAGGSWDKVTAIPDGEASRLIMHEFESTRAYVMTEGVVHYRTEDRGKTWEAFMTDSRTSLFQFDVLTFHSGDPDRIIFNGMDCDGIFCNEVAMYTLDGFRTDAKFLRGGTSGCWWARSSGLFTTGEEDLDAQRTLCIVRDSISPFKQDQRLLISDNYFSAVKADGVIQEFEPNLDMDRPVQGVVNLAVVKKYLLVATTSLNTDEMALFVTDDTKKWHRAVFPTDHRINQEAYTVLESTNYSIQIDVMTSRPSDPMGVMFTSNSNGTYFTRNVEYTNRNRRGHVDFEKIAGIQGIFLVNRVENGEQVHNERAKKKVVTEITFDDGRTFAPVTLKGGKRIHLHSVTDLSNVGRVFSSPAPGLVMAVGNTGDYLEPYEEGSLYISDDAGVTWIEGPKGPHKYEFGDQGSILLAVKDARDVGEVTYSLDHGKTWKIAEFPEGLKVTPYILTTTQDSTSLKFVLVGDSGDRAHVISIDFDGLHEDTCKDSDMEDWWARVDDKGEPTCLMGHTQKYRRRKKDSECFLKQEFKDPVVETTDCECTDSDFECDYNFRREGNECVQAGPISAPEEACKGANPDDTFKGSSGWRLIPGNTCKRTNGEQKDDPKERKCSESESPPPPPATGKIDQKPFDFSGSYNDFEKHYLERGDSSSASDETIIMRPIDRVEGEGGPVWVTHDHGKTWEQPPVFEDARIWAIIPHQYFKEMVFFVPTKGRVIYTVDHGQHWHDFEPPYPPAYMKEKAPLAFHPDKKDWLIWLGETCDKKTKECYLEASYSKDRGDSWHTLLRYAERCEFIGSSAYKYRKTDEVLCLARARETSDEEDNPLQLVSSSDWFQDTKEVREENVKDFATMAEFIVVAAEDTDKRSLRALTSLDGETFAEAHFPHNFAVPHQHAYTVLDSSTHAVNLFVATNTKEDRRFGSIIKSNSNGTSYVMSISGVNCNNRYYVDFEKMLGLEGVVIVNVVANPEDDNAPKRLQTKISHNDGAEWAFLPPPQKDVDGKDYSCSGRGDAECALHIHGYTEREDHRNTYSSEGAVGLMFGVGNVGGSLGGIEEADTFMTTDAGITWKNVKKGAWTWQFGDQGSIIVLVQRHKKTKTVSYTTDEGATWFDYEFYDEEVEVLDITTLRSGSSRNFLLWCKKGSARVLTVNLDFSGLTDRPCVVQDKDLDKSDYYLWSPKHPLMPESQCLFGHVSQYLRKKTDRTCYNGYKIQHLYNTENCTCTRRDYECDYNYELDNHGQCSLVPGFQPMSKEEWCSDNPEAVNYYPPTGFRRIPLTTCQGGVEYDKQTRPQPCKGHEDEFEREHSGPGPVGLFFAITVPIAVAAAVGWYVWRNWTGKFGSIRLGDQGTSHFTLDHDSPLIRYPVIAISAVVAVVGAIPVLVAALWRTGRAAAERWGLGGRGGWARLGGGGGTRRFTTRDSFGRGRGDYAIVDEDEGELLGEESDEEV